VNKTEKPEKFPDNEDWVVFIPDKEKQSLDRMLIQMEAARDEFSKIENRINNKYENIEF
jgi:hypothetical protein